MMRLEVVTPEKLLLQTETDEVIVPGLNGELGILPGHAPLISQLKPAGILTYRTGSTTNRLAVANGFLEVLDDKVTVLAEIAERPEDIDVARARAARERAEKRLAAAERDPDIDIKRAMIKLERALIRLQLAAKGE